MKKLGILLSCLALTCLCSCNAVWWQHSFGMATHTSTMMEESYHIWVQTRTELKWTSIADIQSAASMEGWRIHSVGVNGAGSAYEIMITSENGASVWAAGKYVAQAKLEKTPRTVDDYRKLFAALRKETENSIRRECEAEKTCEERAEPPPKDAQEDEPDE